MREIKFRAWDKDEKQMSFFDLWNHTPDDLWRYVADIDNNNPKEDWLKRNVLVMQFTGLTDKNGKDIYEGDVVKIRGTRNKMFVVKWDESETGFYYQYPSDEVESYLISKSGVEIIGNIYEHTELISPEAKTSDSF